jgi:hypothetical protein
MPPVAGQLQSFPGIPAAGIAAVLSGQPIRRSHRDPQAGQLKLAGWITYVGSAAWADFPFGASVTSITELDPVA